ncbi:adenylate cyclase [Flavobacterium cyanobacteriorum]|uniref:Adenylate cyclase n=1 Tax=Flavobacterium cyanobacteriorum TaxID=2022802 RepID=A0A255YRJ0_9FLAO|nr:CYTH domain-containing protein [Flavobacterium cyanobacteriorum]OYQ31847.1 adenylate cyclase [Flavobacterium cyanobacteriorum]
MTTETERKFLVLTDDFKGQAASQKRIVQGYLSSHPDRTVRVRIKGTKGYLTIKGRSNESGTTRMEWEKEIPVADAEQLLALCEKGIIEKVRYEIPHGQHLFEVDVFSGDNQGLIIAEVELAAEGESFSKPAWLGAEVTGNEKYYNAFLSITPYKMWKDL